jgi:hypothetical protein
VRSATLLLAVVACGDPAVTIAPVYDLPVDDPDATPTGLERLTLAAAVAGSDQDLAAVGFAPGDHVELTGLPPAGAMVVHLTGFIGEGSVAYGRTCAVGVTAAGADEPSPHLWFARKVKFGTVDATPSARRGAHDGQALIVGAHALAEAAPVEAFDPRTARLEAVATVRAREGAIVAALGPGPLERIVVVGGAVAGAPVPTVEAITPGAVPPVERLADEPQLARLAATATSLTDGRVVVIGGRSEGAAASESITELALRGGAVEIRAAAARLAHPRAEHTAIRLGDDVGAPVLIAGGVGPAGNVAVAELWKPLSGELADPATFAPRMVVPRRGHVARGLPDGSVLVIGGVDDGGQPVRTLERYALDSGFEAVGELPPAVGTIDVTATVLPDARILIVGGRVAPGGPPVDAAVIARLDAISGTIDVVATDRLAQPRAGHQATLLCDGTVLVTGGADQPAPPERYNPPAAGRR